MIKTQIDLRLPLEFQTINCDPQCLLACCVAISSFELSAALYKKTNYLIYFSTSGLARLGQRCQRLARAQLVD